MVKKKKQKQKQNLHANIGDTRGAGSIPELGRSPGGGHGKLLQYSCLENLMDRGAWQATVHRVTKSLTEQNNVACITKTLQENQRSHFDSFVF